MGKHRVFVYGTLKRGLSNSVLMRNAEFLGTAYTVDTFRMGTCGFPVLFFSDNGNSVLGEVYDVDDKTLRQLDNLESVGRMYDRKKISVVYTGEQSVIENECFVYIGCDDYWRDGHAAPYTQLNEHGELEWFPSTPRRASAT